MGGENGKGEAKEAEEEKEPKHRLPRGK